MTRLSNRQFPLLSAFADQRDGEHMTIEEAQHFDQRPFRSMLIRKWVAYTGKGFKVTKDGRAALREFLNTDITRKDPTLPLTAYFDPTAYGLKKPQKKRDASHAKVREMRQAGAA